jgi:drug/metabolite transporter (DMT)-like permease
VASRKSALSCAAIASLLWGTTFVASQVGLQYANPYTLVFLRFATATVVIAVLAPFGGRFGFKAEVMKSSTWLLGGIYSLGFLFQYVGQSLTSASEATLLSNLSPILVPLVAFIALRDFLTNAQKAATILGLSGLFLVASPRFATNLTSVLGDLVLVGTSVCYTLFIVLSKRLKATSVGGSFAVTVIVAIFLMPIAVIFGGLNLSGFDIGLIGWVSVVYMGTMCTLVALALYFKGLSVVTASEAAVLLLVQILTGLVLAASFLGQSLNPTQAVGAATILLALVLGVKRTGGRQETGSS